MKRVWNLVFVVLVVALTLTACTPMTNRTQKNLHSKGQTLQEYSEAVGFHFASMQVLSFDESEQTLQTVIDGQPVTLRSYGTQDCEYYYPCNNLEVVYIGDNHFVEHMGMIDFYKESLFTDEFVIETKGVDWVVMDLGDYPVYGLVMVPADIMPEVVDDISEWNDTSTTLYIWRYSMGPDSIIQNMTTGEIFYGEVSLSTFDDLGRMDVIHPGTTAWGYLHVETYDGANGEPETQLYLSQSAPDLQTMQKAVDYYVSEYGSTANYGPGFVCFLLQYYARSDYDTAVAKQYCGVYYVGK
ncbi:MAG TPA: hypothetical protein PLI45_04780 [Candidatus Woesebacteria bacterium]|nr:hypothetical protein [Candidatus Woesebacteria bacterium]